MSDRHFHCAYFQGSNHNSLKGKCLLKDKDIEFGFRQCCDDVVLRPYLILSYYLNKECGYTDWVDADREAIEFLERYRFNDYPKIQKGGVDL